MRKWNKIILAVWIGLLPLFFSCGNRPGKSGADQTVLGDSLDTTVLEQRSSSPVKLYVQPSIYPLSTPSIHYEFVNFSESSVSLGHYSIEHFNGDGWEDIPLGYIFADEEIQVLPGRSFEGKANLNPEYGYKRGKYRLSSYVFLELNAFFGVDTVFPTVKQSVDYFDFSVSPERCSLSTKSFQVTFINRYPGMVSAMDYVQLYYLDGERQNWMPVNSSPPHVRRDTLMQGDTLIIQAPLTSLLREKIARGKYRVQYYVRILLEAEFILR